MNIYRESQDGTPFTTDDQEILDAATRIYAAYPAARMAPPRTYINPLLPYPRWVGYAAAQGCDPQEVIRQYNETVRRNLEKETGE